jgi:hypothetical protein
MGILIGLIVVTLIWLWLGYKLLDEDTSIDLDDNEHDNIF